MYFIDFILQHLIDVVHSNAKRLLAASQVTVSIDGRERLSAQLKYPSTSDVGFSKKYFQTLSYYNNLCYIQVLSCNNIARKFM